jgi:RimJ/RimL family protein N-acetyltransferase
MDEHLLYGRLVHLTTEEPQVMAEVISVWDRDSEFRRLLDSEPVNQFSVKQLADWIQQDQEKDPPPVYAFDIRSLEEDRVLGFIGLAGNMFPHGDAFVGIGIGDRDFWGKGYGTDAMNVILRYAFQELNLRRVSLDTFEYNPRAIRSYEKAGFVHEGRAREYLLREGRRWDLIYMGILREEWLVQDRR